MAGSPDTVATWSRRIAERVTPAEATSAERIAAAYLAGGRRRRDLLRAATGAEPGGFGGALGPGELPVILDGLRYLADHLLGLASGHPLAELLALLVLRGITGAASQDENAAEPGSPPREENSAGPELDRVIGAFGDRLRAQGVAPDRARELTYDTLKLVFQHDRDTPEIEAFLRALAGSPPAAPLRGGPPPVHLPAVRGDSTGWMLPPWLWFYLLGVTAPSVPGLVEGFQADTDGMPALVAALASGAQRAAVALLTGTGLLEFFPAALLFAGIAGVLFPGLRGRWAERRHHLEPSGDPVIEEMSAFVRRHASAIELRLGERHDRTARVHPVGRREARIAVYPPLLRLWHDDREAAQAVLLHEVAHLRQGDHLIVGLAGPFGWFVRVWSVILLALVVVVSAFSLLAGGYESSALLASLLHDAALIPIGLILPVAGLWVAELSADRFALHEAGPDALRRALGPVRSRRLIGRILDGLTHPPLRLRLWATGPRPGAAVALAALWPAAVVVRIGAIAVFALLTYLLTGYSLGDAFGSVARDLRADLASAQATLFEMIVLLVNWPILAPLWMRIWTSVRTVRQRFAPYLLSALIPGALVTGGLTAGGPSAGTVAGAVPAATGVPLPTAGAPSPLRTGPVDDRPWDGRPLPVEMRITAFTPLIQRSGPSEWKGIAAGWLGSGVWRAEQDGRLTFSTLANRPGLRPGAGHWLRADERITFWLAVELDVQGATVTTEIGGDVDLTRKPAVMNAQWAPASTDLAALMSAPALEFTAPLDLSTTP
ncbi:M48 family metalloprotease [Sphaerisporangium sp. NPDC049002]|uniref:M48 family metalloprotease n=1 Tax=unclassified Sphaerisporangium TaxID=2630420 RepID=UPI00340F720F